MPGSVTFADTERPSDNSPLATQGLATPSRVPTATIGYQQTAIVAQATADEARRINVQATVEYQKVFQAQIQTTADAEQRNYEKLSWTVTAMRTSIPLTATAQSMNSTAIAKQQEMLAAQMTQTKEAPALVREMSAARANANFAFVDVFVRMFALFSTGIFMLSISVFALRSPKQAAELASVKKQVQIQSAYLKPDETVIRVQSDSNTAYPSMDRMVIPCKPEQFTALVKGVLNDGIPLSYKHWESKDGPFVRNEYSRVRNFLQQSRLAKSAGGGSLELTNTGERLFIEWLNSQQLPEDYKFKDEKKNE